MIPNISVASVVVKPPARGRHCGAGEARLRVLLGVVCWCTLSTSGWGQSYVKAWGTSAFDTRLNGETFVEIEAGLQHTVARRGDGSIVAWGLSVATQCTVPAIPAGLTCVQIAAGSHHTAARLSDGTAIAWGDSSHGKCVVPPPPAGLTYAEVKAGGSHTVARLSDGSVIAWGYNNDGQCSVPPPPAGLVYVEVSAGNQHTIARLSDGSVVGWGNNTHGECTAPPLPVGVTYTQLAAGDNHSFAVRSDGAIAAWGQDIYGQVTGVPALPAGVTYIEVATSYGHSAARRSDGSAIAWGNNTFGQCNVPPLANGLSYVEVAIGQDHTVARRSDGSVVAWGANSLYQCNVPSAPAGADYAEIDGGLEHVVLRRSDGSIVAFGANLYGQLNVPALPAGLTYVEICAGGWHSAARRSDGSVVAWGQNQFGQCTVPSLPAGVAFAGVSAGHTYTLGRCSDGSIVAWGDNADGQCLVPPLPGGLAYVEVAAGNTHAVALRSDGSVVAWGDNTLGGCNVPPLPPGIVYVEVAAGFRHTLARRSDGSVVAWGNNSFGQCNVPALPAGVTYVDLAAASVSSVARRSDNAVVVWGFDNQNQSAVASLPAGLSHVEIAATPNSCVLTRYGSAGAVQQYDGVSSNHRTGERVRGVGDVNGDGVPDFAYSIPGASNNAGGFTVRSGLTGVPLFSDFACANSNYGQAIAGGDINGDGLSDVMVSSRNSSCDNGLGFVKAYYGPSGQSTSLRSSPPGAGLFGESADFAGDVDGDGFGDIIVGTNPGSTTPGNAYVCFGPDLANYLTITGGQTGASFGLAVAGAGNLDADARPDVVIGVPELWTGGPGYVAAFAITPSRTAQLLYTQFGGGPGELFGASVAGVLDVDHDGRADFAVGSSNGPVTRVLSGATGSVLYTFNNAGSGVGRAGDFNGDGTPDVLTFGTTTVRSGCDGSVLAVLAGNVGDFVGDLNLDGSAEVVIGSPFASTGGMTQNGLVAIFAGIPPSGPCAAASLVIGTGCGGAGIPALWTNLPRIGQNLTFALSQGTPNAFGNLYLSSIPAVPIDLGLGCTAAVDLATVAPLLPVVTDAAGTWSFTFALPYLPTLVGAQVALQVALLGTAGPFFGLDLSNGRHLRVGY